MAHQEGWIELYGDLEAGRSPSADLVELCKSSRTGIGETMLHWYVIEGAPDILRKMIDLGFEVNVQNEFGNTPLMEAGLIGRWENAEVLLENGARMDLRNSSDENFEEFMRESDQSIPEWVSKYAQQAPAEQQSAGE